MDAWKVKGGPGGRLFFSSSCGCCSCAQPHTHSPPGPHHCLTPHPSSSPLPQAAREGVIVTQKFFMAQSFSLFNFTKFIGVALVNKVMWVSSVHFCNRSSVYCITLDLTSFTTQSQASFCHHIFDPLYTILPPANPSSPLVTTILLSVSVSFCLFMCCFQFYIPHMSEIIWLWTFPV